MPRKPQPAALQYARLTYFAAVLSTRNNVPELSYFEVEVRHND